LRDDLVGPIDPAKFINGEWDRKWAGLATAHLAFVDEIGKGSGQTNNMLLGAMEERQVMTGDTIKDIPLFTLFSASNELFKGESEALWDRFVVRTIVDPVKNASDFQRMLTADITPINKPIDPADLSACIAETKRMVSAIHLSQEVKTTCTELWVHLSSKIDPNDCYVSDRRWRYTLRLAAGLALAEGCDQVKPEHLSVARFTLWSEPRHIEILNPFIDSIVDTAARELKECTVKLKDIEKAFVSLNGSTDLNKLALINVKLDKLSNELQVKQGSEWNKLRSNVQELKSKVLA